jgi:hypothetical protein
MVTRQPWKHFIAAVVVLAGFAAGGASAAGPTIDNASVLITARKIDCAYPGGQRDETQFSWVPIMKFKVNGPIPSGAVFTVDYFLPGTSTPWISFDLNSAKVDTNAWYSYDRAGGDIGDQQGTTLTGSIGFKISMRNELDGTPKTILLSGSFTVENYNFNNYPEDKNKFDYYVNQDWRLPVAFLSGNWLERSDGGYSENMTPRLLVTAWLHGDSRIKNQAFLYYQGREISPAEGEADQNALTAEASRHNWVSFTYAFRAFWYKQGDNPTAFSWFNMSENPGDYQVKIFVKEQPARVIDFKIGVDGKLVDNGFAGQANFKYSWIFPAKITGFAEGTIDKQAYKTGAFYGNPLPGFTVP